jgi:hypothetical protein
MKRKAGSRGGSGRKNETGNVLHLAFFIFLSSSSSVRRRRRIEGGHGQGREDGTGEAMR